MCNLNPGKLFTNRLFCDKYKKIISFNRVRMKNYLPLQLNLMLHIYPAKNQ